MVHCSAHTMVQLVLILTPMNPIHTPLPLISISILILSFHLHLNILMVTFFQVLLSKFFIKSSPLYAIRPFHHILNLTVLLIFGDESKLWVFSLCSFLQSPATLSLLGPYIPPEHRSKGTSISVFPLMSMTKLLRQYEYLLPVLKHLVVSHFT